MVRIIINADDCGYSPEVNTAINHALAVGAISSTTILANSKYLDEVKRMAERYPNASFGIHLNLTEGESLTKSSVLAKYGIIDSEGKFVKGNSKRCSNPNNELKDAIKKEWDAQLNLLTSEGFKLSHIDGHHHCHTWPGLEVVLVDLMHKYGLMKTRNRYKSPNIYFKDKVKQSIRAILIPFRAYSTTIQSMTEALFFYKKFNSAIDKGNIKSTDYFDSYEGLSGVLVKGLIDDCVVELMCHPGNPLYKTEEQALLNDQIGLKSHALQLISYKEL